LADSLLFDALSTNLIERIDRQLVGRLLAVGRLRSRVGDKDVDDSERQHGADLLVGQAGAKELFLGHLGVNVMNDVVNIFAICLL
jgi:hypothetical protein